MLNMQSISFKQETLISCPKKVGQDIRHMLVVIDEW